MKIVDMYFWSIGMNTTGKLEIKTFDKTGDDFGYQSSWHQDLIVALNTG